MLPLAHRIAFLVFAILTGSLGARGFLHLCRRIRRGATDTDPRFNKLPRRLIDALTITLLQSRTFRKRPWVSFFHSFIFYGFVYYALVNVADGLEGYSTRFRIGTQGPLGATYSFTADLMSALVLAGALALVARRFWLPSRRDFRFNERTLLHERVKHSYIARDSLIVSLFILFHVGSRAVGAGAKLLLDGPDAHQPFATAISHLLPASHAQAISLFGYWGALGSVLVFLSYFPYTKHVHLFFAPVKYVIARDAGSGTLPALELQMDAEDPKLGAAKLEDLAWPRLVDAYACIQCNRCQDVCPASATGKSLSPAALEINKRMELNGLARHGSAFENGGPSPRPLLAFALSDEAAWACTTCGACMQVCPTQNEQMLDIIDIRRHQVMVEGDFPSQLQTAFRGMERAKNPWGLNADQRLAWAEGLRVPTIEQNPEPDVLYWVGCAASYDPQAQQTARAFVQLLDHAGVDFAVLGKRECCTGDSARRAGNEYLYRQLADQNVSTLNTVRPKKIVATCPHCLNSLGKEYRQIGGEYTVEHHTQFLESLVSSGRLKGAKLAASITYHDPCYLGRHNDVYDAPRNLLKVLSNDVTELPRHRENSFCCGAGGAQFWKEEEPGGERISTNRFREVEETLAGNSGAKVLSVGCPFCKSMFQSSPGKNSSESIVVKDLAELLLESLHGTVSGAAASGLEAATETNATPANVITPMENVPLAAEPVAMKAQSSDATAPAATPPHAVDSSAVPTERKKWMPKPK